MYILNLLVFFIDFIASHFSPTATILIIITIIFVVASKVD